MRCPIRSVLLGCAIAWVPASLTAQAPSGVPLTLSDTEKAEVLSHNTEASVADARAGIDRQPGRRVHGEIGAGVGSNGLRTVYGAAAIPLGDDAGAFVSFERSRFGSRR